MIFLKNFIKFLFCKILFRVQYYNIENLQKYDKFLICPNHSSIFDPFFIYSISNNLSIMAKSEIFKNKLIAKILKHYNIFPVDRKKVDFKSLLKALSVFNNDSCTLLIFPEGGVIKNKEDIGKKFHNGASFISAKLNIPIVPVFITRRPKLFSKVEVIFGKPIFMDKNLLKNKNDLKISSKNLINIIYNLKNKSSN